MPRGGESLIYIALAVYWAVLIAELIGDKTIYTVTSLAGRFRARVVLPAIVAAYSAKMAVAVLFGSLLVRLDAREVAIVSAGAFFLSALVIVLRRPREEGEKRVDWSRGAVACFTSLFLTEWGDPGQLVAAASSARFHAPLVVWAAGTVAMTTKGGLALLLGVQLRDRLPQQLVRRCAAVTLLVLGVLTLTQITFS